MTAGIRSYASPQTFTGTMPLPVGTAVGDANTTLDVQRRRGARW